MIRDSRATLQAYRRNLAETQSVGSTTKKPPCGLCSTLRSPIASALINLAQNATIGLLEVYEHASQRPP
jgi:hypothetical protein